MIIVVQFFPFWSKAIFARSAKKQHDFFVTVKLLKNLTTLVFTFNRLVSRFF